MGFQLEPHPDLRNKASHPDFLVKKNTQPLLYLEATITTESIADAGAQKRIDQVYEALDKLDSPDFYLSVEVQGSPRTPPSGADLRLKVAKWLKTLDYSAIRTRWEIDNLSSGPVFAWEHDGWELTIAPIPKAPERRGSNGIRSIGITMPAASCLYLQQDIRKAIEEKSRYGNLDYPYVIAINVLDEFRIDRIDVFNALFGDETWVPTRQGAEVGRRVLNGAWYAERGPRNKKLSAVMIYTNLSISDARDQNPWVVHNPWATHPLPFETLPLSQLVPDRTNNIMSEKEGLPCSEFLGLPEQWPPAEI